LSFHALCCVGTVRWRLILGCLAWKKGPNMSSYTFNGRYGSMKEWCWGVSAITFSWIHGRWQKLPQKSHALCCVGTVRCLVAIYQVNCRKLPLFPHLPNFGLGLGNLLLPR
jgi:hypothetical protein